MKKAASQRSQPESRSAAQHGGGVAVKSPQSAKISQLEAMSESNQQAKREHSLAVKINSSPAMIAQSKISGSIDDSPRVVAQRKVFDALAGTAQLFTPQQGLVQRKIGEEGNVIFGLSGRDAEAIRAAVDAGYTTFDGADSYGDTIIHLAAAIKAAEKKGKARASFDVIYKVDKTPPKDLEAHLRSVAAMLGYIDHVLIHKVTDSAQAEKYSPILAALKMEGLIIKVGAGDVQAGMDTQFKGQDSFEVDANDLFLAPDTDTLIEKLNKSGKPVFVYNIVGTLKNLLGLGGEQLPAQSEISAMVNKIKGLVPQAEPILSSKTAEKAAANLKIHEPEDEMLAFESYGRIEEGARRNNPSVPVADMEASVRERVTGILFGGYDWGAESLFATEIEYAKTRDQMLTSFTAEELSSRYRGETKVFTLRQLINMLFDPSGNCHRVEASNFLT